MKHVELETMLSRQLISGRREVVLIAPFMKRDVVARLLDVVSGDVDVHLYTRWRPEEVARGVSDTAVFDLAGCRPRTKLSLVDRLHAKAYLVDDVVFLGSANLTNAALNDGPHTNLEVLAQFPAADARPLFAAVQAEAWSPDATYRRLMDAAAEAIRPLVHTAMTRMRGSAAAAGAMAPGSATAANLERDAGRAWWPTTRYPSKNLWKAYSGRSEELTAAAREQTATDLAWLSPPLGLSREKLDSWVALSMARHAFTRRLDAELRDGPRRFGAVRELARSWLASEGLGRDPSEAWQTYSRWLLCFLPQRYAQEVPGAYSEVFSLRPQRHEQP